MAGIAGRLAQFYAAKRAFNSISRVGSMTKRSVRSGANMINSARKRFGREREVDWERFESENARKIDEQARQKQILRVTRILQGRERKVDARQRAMATVIVEIFGPNVKESKVREVNIVLKKHLVPSSPLIKGSKTLETTVRKIQKGIFGANEKKVLTQAVADILKQYDMLPQQ